MPDRDYRRDPRRRHENRPPRWEREYNRPYYESNREPNAYEEEVWNREYNRPYWEESVEDEEEWSGRGYEARGEYDRDIGTSRPRSPYGTRPRSGAEPYYEPGQEMPRRYETTYSEAWWLVPGPYQGVGPKGYHRSDERIHEEVCERLAGHGYIDASDIDIQVENGEITLNGMVGSRREKRLAEDLVDRVSGVRDVHNQLRVRQEGQYGGQMGRTQGGQAWDEPAMGGTPRGSWGSQGMTREESMRQGQTGMGGDISGRLHSEMEVVSADGAHVGKVKEVRSSDFLVDREMARDVYVPLNSAQISGGRVMLNIRADQIDDQGWPNPDIT